MELAPKPFTVVGGFLGAGKTTLINRVLSTNDGVRYAVLVNDFGDLAVDEALIQAHDGQTIALANGCICCTMSDGLISAMLALMQAPERFDHVLVEASGVSEPDRIMDFARFDPLLTPEAIVVLADAETIAARLEDRLVGETVRHQVEAADLVVLNRADLCGEATLAEAETVLRRVNTAAAVVRSAFAEVPLTLVLGPEVEARSGTSGMHGHAHEHHHSADELFITKTVEFPSPIPRAEFEIWADALPSGVIRGKGFIRFEGEDGAWLWQRVGVRWSLVRAAESLAPHAPVSSWAASGGDGPSIRAFIATQGETTGDDLAGLLVLIAARSAGIRTTSVLPY